MEKTLSCENRLVVAESSSCYNPRTMSEPLIETSGLTKRFGSFTAVDGANLRVSAGEILVLLGPNGAGKTTTIRLLASILRPTQGWARVAGYDVVNEAMQVRRRIGLLTEHHGLYTRMQASEYLSFFGSAYGLDAQDILRRSQALLQDFGLEAPDSLRLGHYSKGMRQKLALVRSLLHDPPVLLLDEPTSAMDPASARLVRESIARLRSAERALVVSTHNLGEAEILADHIAIIRRGRVIVQGTAEQLRRQFLGDPIMELRLARPVDGGLSYLPPDTRAVAVGPDWVRFQTSHPEKHNPRVLGAMAQANVPVLTLSEVGRSLEEVYLEVVRRFEQDGSGQ